MKTDTTTTASPAAPPSTVDPVSASADFEADLENLFAEVTADEEEEAPEAPVKVKAKAKAPKEPEAEAEADEVEEDAAEPEEGSADEDEEDADEEKAALRNPDKFQAILDARRAKLQKAREERAAAVAEAEALRQQIAEMQDSGPPKPVLLTPTGLSPLADVHSEEQLQQAEANAEAQLKWCRDNRQGGTLRNGDELSAEQVAAMEDRALHILRKAIPARQRYLQTYQEDIATAARTLPFLTPGHALHDELAAFGDRELNQYPDLAAHPRHVSMLAQVFAFRKLAAGTHQLIPRADGTLQLVSVKPGTPAPAKSTTTPAKPPTVRPATVSAPLPKRRDTSAARQAERLASDDPMEAFSADMEDLYAAASR